MTGGGGFATGQRGFAARPLLVAVALAALGAQGPGKEPPPPPRLAQPYVRERVEAGFHGADHDENGWLSYRELRGAIGADRREFTVFDTDGDGRVDLAEFDRQVKRLLDNGAHLKLPESRPADGAESRAASGPAGSRPASGPASAPADRSFRLTPPAAASKPSKKATPLLPLPTPTPPKR